LHFRHAGMSELTDGGKHGESALKGANVFGHNQYPSIYRYMKRKIKNLGPPAPADFALATPIIAHAVEGMSPKGEVCRWIGLSPEQISLDQVFVGCRR
jgi:hypothetical protein